MAKHTWNFMVSVCKHHSLNYCIIFNNLHQNKSNSYVCSENFEVTEISPDVHAPDVLPFDYSRDFNFLIHGWHDGWLGEAIDWGPPKAYIDRRLRKDLWMEPLGQKWFNYTNSNVVIVDWSSLARGSYDDTVRTKLPRAVEEIVAEMEKYMGRGMEIQSVTIAGHSLGAHVAGSVGRAIKEIYGKKIKAIYGLDPAGPLFGHDIGIGKFEIDNYWRLDPSDARYVQCVETSIAGIDLDKFPCGHANFKFGRAKFQPVCKKYDIITTLTTCDHSSAKYYFAQSLNPENEYIGIRKNCVYKCYSDNNTEKFGIYNAGKRGHFIVGKAYDRT